MQKQGVFHQRTLFNFVENNNQKLDSGHPKISCNLFLDGSINDSGLWKGRMQYRTQSAILITKETHLRKLSKINSMLHENVEESFVDDDELCPVDCVREFYTDEEFSRILEKANESNALVVVDFYRTSCGSCKYIEQGFAKLCKGSGDQDAPVIFLKHNVLDEYDEQSEVAERLRIRTVPLFHFYKNGVLLEAFPTRDKERILEAIRKYTASSSCSLEVDSVS